MAQTVVLAVNSTVGEQSTPRTIAAGSTESLYLTGPHGTIAVWAGGKQQGAFRNGTQLVGPLTYYVQRVAGNCGCTVES